MARKKACTWLWILLGVIVLLTAVGAIMLVGTGYYLYTRHVDVRTATAQSAEHEFEAARQPFAGQEPLLAVEDHDLIVRGRPRTREDQPAPEALHLLVWDATDDRLVRLTVPFWLFRLVGRGAVNVQAGPHDIQLDELDLTADEIERAGPGLILDHHDSSGARVLIWAQ